MRVWPWNLLRLHRHRRCRRNESNRQNHPSCLIQHIFLFSLVGIDAARNLLYPSSPRKLRKIPPTKVAAPEPVPPGATHSYLLSTKKLHRPINEKKRNTAPAPHSQNRPAPFHLY